MRLRLYDVRLSDFPSIIGVCPSNVKAIANAVNSVQQRLIYAKEARDEGWWGTFAEIAFSVSRAEPFITLPREVARIEAATVCRHPIPMRNMFYEYLDFGNGRMPKLCNRGGLVLAGYERNGAVTFKNLTGNRRISVYITDPLDGDGQHRVFLSGKDENLNTVYSQDFFNNVQGVFMTLETPSVMSSIVFSQLTGIQKDITQGALRFMEVDPDTGDETLILTMEPGEQVAWYRRYYFHSLPSKCGRDDAEIQVTAIAKLQPLPVRIDTDYLLLQNMEALMAEADSMRLSRMDSADAKQQAIERHKAAIGFLNGELSHYYGTQNVSVTVKPFGSASLERQRIGTMI